ncbi:hypothetical protein H2201_001204 [Coniosporium apollinis]|uniref:SUZ domain-containing protein n=2 Tax=Coniosporium TaxID=2810619 RepID=A0ABQ9P2G9_9PEZI|nr:hypothetical protein H2199_001616 [Cladosporium sp. JES 115]KAJ9668562.1 hypothetical protein H2201_001204 [Coniosporium apollinis]
MSKKGAVPDAWDDDWETLADKPEEPSKPVQQPVKITKAERKAQHAEANRQLWQSAEDPNPDPYQFLKAREDVPLKTDFKPALKVLSRKPPPAIVKPNGNAAGIAAMQIADDGDDSEEEERRKNEQAFAERQAKAAREREEKQRKYQEVRERLFGSSASGTEESPSRASSAKPEGAGRAARSKGRRESPLVSSADQSPARAGNQKQLYDPGYTAKPNSVYLQKREATEGRSRSATPSEEQPTRMPRGPDGSGRGGFGFAPRGSKTGSAA